MRGERWARVVWAEATERRTELLTRPWPAHEGRAELIARRRVDDIGGRDDERVAQVLSAWVAEAAAQEWARLQAERDRDVEEAAERQVSHRCPGGD
ncbi:MAG: hypothetical protein ACTHU0_19070 [Kofleriaceae bacterium]